MCKFKLFSIAAAALMMAACSTEDLTQQTQIKTGEMHFTATIAAPSGTTRTTYEQDGDNINVKWVVGDEIALIHNKVKDVATVKTINADGSATITGYVTGSPKDEDPIQLFYPAALISGVTSDGNPVFDSDVSANMNKQDGTLEFIQKNLDFRNGGGLLSVNGSEATLKEAAKMYAMIAIWKLKLKDNASALLEASKVSIEMGSGDYRSGASATPSSPKSELTIATTVAPAVDNVRPITIEATVGNNTYVYKQDNVDVTPGKYYQSTVTMKKLKVTDLSTLTGNHTAEDGETLKGTLGGNYKISIAAGATVTLDGVTINGVDDSDYSWAGITCLGDATIILKDGTTNTVNGFYNEYPGIYVPGDAEIPANNKTLTIKGTGSLTANCKDKNGRAAGIGGNSDEACGNIVIAGGTVSATGGSSGAGIGSGKDTSCGAITISGGTVTATGGSSGAGIGSGYYGKCGDILISGGTVSATGGAKGAGIGSGYSGRCGTVEITTGVTQVTATKGSDAENSIGKAGAGASCGTVTIGGVVGAISTSSYTYPVTYPVALSAVTGHYIGSVVTTDGNVYATVADATAASKTAVAMIAYVGTASDCAHGLAIALADESSSKMTWNTAKSTCSGKTPTITGGTWRLPSIKDWQYMFIGCGASGSYSDSPSSMSYSGLASKLTTAQGGGFQTAYYWSSTEDNPEHNPGDAFYLFFVNGTAVFSSGSENECRVRACLAF